MHDDMIERVATAIIGTMFAPHELPLPDDLADKYRATARAAIEAMREPTGEMVDALLRTIEETKNPAPTKTVLAWYAMIDAALQKDASNAR